MADYEQLMNLEKKRNPAPPVALSSVEVKARKPASPPDGLPASPLNLLPAKPQAGKPANPQTILPAKEQVEKYTTRLQPSIIKQIRVYAAENDIADYEVVKRAVNAFLEKKK